LRALVLFTVVEIIEVGRLVEEVGRDEGDHLGIAAAVFAEVEDDGVDMGEKVHGGDGGWAAEVRISEKIELQVADVAGQNLNFCEPAVGMLQRLSEHGFLLGAWALLVGRKLVRAVVDVQMLVVADFLQVFGEL
jgi:hypothetical protein